MLRAEGSSADVGSSRIKICTGSLNTCASASFCFIPVEYVLTFLPRSSFMIRSAIATARSSPIPSRRSESIFSVA